MKVSARHFVTAFAVVFNFVVRLLAAPSRMVFSPLLRLMINTFDAFRAISIRTLGAQVISLLLLISILTTSTPAMQPTLLFLSTSSNEIGQDIRYSYLSSPGLSNLGTFISETNATLAANISSASVFELIGSINPVLGLITGKHIFRKGRQQAPPQRVVILPTNETNTLTVLQGEKINFTAVGLGKDDQPIGGLPFTWTQVDTLRNSKPKPFSGGTFEAKNVGTFIVTAEVFGKQAQINVTVMPNGGAGVQRLIEKARQGEGALDKTESGMLNDLRQKGMLTTREISTKGKHDPEAEERLDQLDKKKREEVKARQDAFRAKNPNPIEQLRQRLNNRNQPNVQQPNQTRPQGGPSAGDESEVAEASANEETPAENSDALILKAAPRAESQIFSNNSAVAARAAAVRPPDEDFWDGGNYWQATSPSNSVGNTPGSAPSSGAANGNMTMAAPVISLAGRGLDVNLAMYYNSRLWSKAGSVISYDPDKGNPAPGWNIGYGKLVNLGGAGCMIVEGDGTRRAHNGTNSNYTYGGYYSNSYSGYTTDGSFTNYSCSSYSWNWGSGFNGTVFLPNGTIIDYQSTTSTRDQAFPTRITDAQGNYINITYVGNQGPNIQTITDTLGRVITFNYDSNGRLVSVTGPGQNGGTRVYVRLHYKQLNLNYAFASGIYPDTPTNAPYVLDAIYYPEVGTGYWFGDNDSYSSYGMIAKVMGMRGMTWAGSGVNDQGTITAGTMSHQEVYNFPLGPDSSLTDAPLYTTQTATWANMDTAAAVTTYGVSTTSTDETVTVTAPNGTKSIQTSYINPGAWNNGVYYKNETRDSSNNLLGKTQTYMQQGDWGSFRPTRIETTDEKNQTTAAEFEYANGVYNQVTKSKDLNYLNNVYRETRTTYDNNSPYTNYRHIFSLVKAKEIYAGTNRLSRTEYEYDNNAANGGSHNLVNTPGVVMHLATADPYTTETYTTPGFCAQWQYNYPECNDDTTWAYIGDYPQIEVYCPNERYCALYSEEETHSVYEPSSVYRGNVTKVTTYSDAANLTGAIVYDSTYDITGNVRTTTTNCCQQMSFGYTINTQYSQPESHAKGSSDPNSPLRMTESATYDFNTGLTKTSTDFNGRTTTLYYDTVNRPVSIIAPTGGFKTIWYGDQGLVSVQAVYDAANVRHGYTAVWTNGRGQQTQTQQILVRPPNDQNPANWILTNTQYDQMGRMTQTTLPYTPGVSSQQWTTYQYDALSRPTQVTAPDGSVSQTFYNETTRPSSANQTAGGQTVRSRDAWGRERWARTDDFGRTAEVVEPDPNGNGSVLSSGSLLTSYSYDALDQLTQVLPGIQQGRWFQYDSLGRLIRHKLAEQNATLNDQGQFVGAGNGQWSEVFAYDSRSNLVQKTDARGVKTNYSYLLNGGVDPLNRLQAVSYDKSGAINDPNKPIEDAGTTTLEYMTTGDQTRVKKATTDRGAVVEENIYDVEGRIAEYTKSAWGRGSYQMTTNYLYDTLSRLTEIRYPAQYGVTGAPRKVVTPSYDETSRLTELKVDNQIQMSEIVYNPLSQITQLKTGAATGNADIEQYGYDSQTGLLTNQKVFKQSSMSSPLLDLSYEYQRGNSSGSTTSGKTGQLTRITDNLNHNRNRLYEFDTLGRLRTAKGGLGVGIGNPVANWTQQYTYDRYGNRTGVAASGVTQNNQAVPNDGIASQTYDLGSNRITTSGYEYDLAGNLTRGQAADGTWQRFDYDAAGRLYRVWNDARNYMFENNEYGSTRQRELSWNSAMGSQITWYAWGGSSVIAEYKGDHNAAVALVWQKSYIYAGSRLLSTFTNNGSGETLEFHHPDRLGTKLVTTPQANNNAGTSFEQSTLPFGTELTAESTGATNQQFTSYDRSTVAQLDYAVNRSYSSGQGRFTSVDPAQDGMNLYAYANNDPINNVDPTGLNASAFGTTYYVDGFMVSEKMGMQVLNSGMGVEIPGGGSGVKWDPSANGGKGEFQFFRAYGNGQSGYYNMQGVSVTATANLNVTDENGILHSWNAGSRSWTTDFHTNELRDTVATIRNLSPDRVSLINPASKSTKALELAGITNSFCSTTMTNKNIPIQFFREAETGRFYGNPFKANRIIGGISKATFGIGTAISVAQMANGDVSIPRGGLDITMGYVGAFGGPKGWLISGTYFVYNSIPDPTYPQGGRRIVSTNTCHSAP